MIFYILEGEKMGLEENDQRAAYTKFTYILFIYYL